MTHESRNESIIASAGEGVLRILRAAEEGRWEAYAFALFLVVWMVVIIGYLVLKTARARRDGTWSVSLFVKQLIAIMIPLVPSAWFFGLIVWKLAMVN